MTIVITPALIFTVLLALWFLSDPAEAVTVSLMWATLIGGAVLIFAIAHTVGPWLDVEPLWVMAGIVFAGLVLWGEYIDRGRA